MSSNKLTPLAFPVFWFMIMFFSGLLYSCTEHEDVYYGDTSVGSILLEDNIIVSPQGFIPSAMKPVGVVIGSRADSVWVVSTKELGEYSYLDTIQNVQNVSSDINALCGRENTAALLQSERTSDAAIAVENFNSESRIKGWSLPSIGELRMLSANLGTVRESIKLIGGDDFSTRQYLSSTQDGSNSQTEALYADCITLETGYISSILKTEEALVRPVLRLKIR